VTIAAGPIVFRDADCFGRTVNIAARAMDRAHPRQVLATLEVVRATDQEAVRFHPLGAVKLRDVSSPVVFAVASRARPDSEVNGPS
jgi:adenylate cyclase